MYNLFILESIGTPKNSKVWHDVVAGNSTFNNINNNYYYYKFITYFYYFFKFIILL